MSKLWTSLELCIMRVSLAATLFVPQGALWEVFCVT